MTVRFWKILFWTIRVNASPENRWNKVSRWISVPCWLMPHPSQMIHGNHSKTSYKLIWKCNEWLSWLSFQKKTAWRPEMKYCYHTTLHLEYKAQHILRVYKWICRVRTMLLKAELQKIYISFELSSCMLLMVGWWFIYNIDTDMKVIKKVYLQVIVLDWAVNTSVSSIMML